MLYLGAAAMTTVSVVILRFSFVNCVGTRSNLVELSVCPNTTITSVQYKSSGI